MSLPPHHKQNQQQLSRSVHTMQSAAVIMSGSACVVTVNAVLCCHKWQLEQSRYKSEALTAVTLIVSSSIVQPVLACLFLRVSLECVFKCSH